MSNTADNLFEKSLSKNENDYYDCKGELFWWIFEDKSHNFMLEAEQFILAKVTLSFHLKITLWEFFVTKNVLLKTPIM